MVSVMKSLTRQVLVINPSKTYPKGRQRQRWLNRIKKNLYQADVTVKMIKSGKRNRQKAVKNLVKAAKQPIKQL